MQKTDSTYRSTNTILLNSKGQRVDAPLAKPFAGMMNAVKARTFREIYHLVGVCSFSNCKHEHGDELSPNQLAARRSLTMMNTCSGNLYCDDEECYASHKCVHPGCKAVEFRFPCEMYDVGTWTHKVCEYRVWGHVSSVRDGKRPGRQAAQEMWQRTHLS